MSRSRRDLVVRLAELVGDYGIGDVLGELAIVLDEAGFVASKEIADVARNGNRSRFGRAEDRLFAIADELEKPKRCSCGAEYSVEAFRALKPAAGGLLQEDSIKRLELRNCTCGSTIAMTRTTRSDLV